MHGVRKHVHRKIRGVHRKATFQISSKIQTAVDLFKDLTQEQTPWKNENF